MCSLLKSQLNNLNNQTKKCFEVIIPDPHYKKRTYLSDYCKNFDFNIKHFPYKPNNLVPKTFDYGIFNTAVLLSESEKIITFQDWRFCESRLVEKLQNLRNHDFVGFLWQVLYKDDEGYSSIHNKSTINIEIDDAKKMFETGCFPEIEIENYLTDTFGNKSWGHYCIDRSLWMELNGLDEVSTNTRHYADLDLNCRLSQIYREKSKEIEIPMVKNCMVRVMHKKGKYFGHSNIEIDEKVNQSHFKCCFRSDSNNGWGPVSHMNDKKFTDFIKHKIEIGEYEKLYELEYSEDFKKNNKNESIDSENSIIGFICKNCKVIGETPHWYMKSLNSRTKSLVDIGTSEYKIGRDLNVIDNLISNKSFEEKVKFINLHSTK